MTQYITRELDQGTPMDVRVNEPTGNNGGTYSYKLDVFCEKHNCELLFAVVEPVFQFNAMRCKVVGYFKVKEQQ